MLSEKMKRLLRTENINVVPENSGAKQVYEAKWEAPSGEMFHFVIDGNSDEAVGTSLNRTFFDYNIEEHVNNSDKQPTVARFDALAIANMLCGIATKACLL